MRTSTQIILAIVLTLGLAVFCGCGENKDNNPETFKLSVDSLDITGEVDDAEVAEVDVNGEKWTVTDKKFSGTVDTTGKDKVEIQAKDASGNTGIKTIEIK
jgi:hypothetical protein